MDPDKRKHLIKSAIARGYIAMGSPRVLVTRHEFFDRNDDEGSIGPNLMRHPGVAAFDSAFQTIERMDGVTAVYLTISEIDEADGF